MAAECFNLVPTSLTVKIDAPLLRIEYSDSCSSESLSAFAAHKWDTQCQAVRQKHWLIPVTYWLYIYKICALAITGDIFLINYCDPVILQWFLSWTRCFRSSRNRMFFVCVNFRDCFVWQYQESRNFWNTQTCPSANMDKVTGMTLFPHSHVWCEH